MKKTLIILAATFFLWIGSVHAGGVDAPLPDSQTLQVLKKSMQNFGALVAGLEIMRAKEPKPDWPVVNKTLQEMTPTLKTMQQADTAGAYKKFTDRLETSLNELTLLSRKKSPKFYESYEQMTQTCFQCHAMHRPVDFMKPQNKGSASR